ncbi:hypothetical protein OIU85_030183 [Salix viminalis]|uniref:Uncharacterized protein n=1 Tax=Salix viminalis TaxID=40686 RepID=A0A9Q0QCX7_SALVM|nr:hypothetical protein OIU85_030183 [Salix viminalis]
MGNDPEDACTHLLAEEDLVNGNDMIGRVRKKGNGNKANASQFRRATFEKLGQNATRTSIENLQKTISSRLQLVFGKDKAAGNLSLSGDDDVNDQVEIFDFPCFSKQRCRNNFDGQQGMSTSTSQVKNIVAMHH